ncbi:MAG: hypothetical protein V1789_12370 [PVC group bacterium]
MLKRLLVLLLIPAALVLLVTPLPTHSSAYVEQDFVFVIASPRSAKTKFDNELPRITREELQPYPHILRAVEDRGAEFASFRVSDEEDGNSLGLEELGKTLSEMEGVSPEDAERHRKTVAKSKEMFRRAEEESRKVQRTLLAARQESWEHAPTDIPVGEWQQMVSDLLDSGEREASFLFDGSLYQGFVRYDSACINQPIPGLEIGQRIAGGVFLLIGILLITGLYREKTGIMIAKRWGIVLWDVISICVSGFFLYGVIDLALVKVFGTPTATEEFLQFMGVFWVVFAIPVLAFLISATAAQAVEIDGKGIRLDGLFTERFIPWEELRGIEVTELRSVKRAGGFTAPKRLMKIMWLTGDSSSITLMEPPLKSTKQRIFEALTAHAPAEWKGTIEEEGKTWRAFF